MQLDEKARQYLSEALNWMLPARIFVDVHFYYNMICLYMHIFLIYGYDMRHVMLHVVSPWPIGPSSSSCCRHVVVASSSRRRRRVVASSSSRRRRAVVVPSSCRRRVVVMSSSRRRHVVASCPSRFLPSSSVYLLNYDNLCLNHILRLTARFIPPLQGDGYQAVRSQAWCGHTRERRPGNANSISGLGSLGCQVASLHDLPAFP